MSSSFEPDRGWSWIVVLAAHGAFLLWEGLCKGLGVMLPTLTVQFDTETWPVGWSVGLMLSARGLSGLLLSLLLKRWDFRQISVTCGILASLGIILASFTTNVVAFCSCIVLLTGACYGIILNLSLVVIRLYFDRHYATANGIACAGTSTGILVFAPMTQLFLDLYGWRGCMMLLGGLNLHCIVVGALYRPVKGAKLADEHQYDPVMTSDPETACQKEGGVPRADIDKGEQPIASHEEDHTARRTSADVNNPVDGKLQDDASCTDDRCSQHCTDQDSPTCRRFLSKIVRTTDLDLFTSPSYLVLLVCVCNLCVVIVAWVVFTVPHVIVKGLTPYQASMVAVAGASGILTGQIAHGPFIDRGIVSPRVVMYVANFLMGASFLLDPLFVTLWPLLGDSFVFGVGFGIALPLSFTMISTLVGATKLHNAVAWVEAVGGITRILASFITGWLYDRTGSYDLSFLVIGIFPCLAIVTFLLQDVCKFISKVRANNHT